MKRSAPRPPAARWRRTSRKCNASSTGGGRSNSKRPTVSRIEAGWPSPAPPNGGFVLSQRVGHTVPGVVGMLPALEDRADVGVVAVDFDEAADLLDRIEIDHVGDRPHLDGQV